MIVPAKFEKGTTFNGGVAMAKKGTWVIVDINGNETLVSGIEDGKRFSEGFSGIKKVGLWGFVNTTEVLG